MTGDTMNATPQDSLKSRPQPSKEHMADDSIRKEPPSYHDSQYSSSKALPPAQGSAGVPETNPPPYHNWQDAVPDTSTFPPAPVISYFNSGAGNASNSDAERAHAFCDSTPLWRPVKPSPAVLQSIQQHDLRPMLSTEFRGQLSPISPGRWKGSTRDMNGDCVALTHLPLYFPVEDSPLVTGRAKTIYFEITLLGLRDGPGAADSSGFSIGFVAQPYPSWRSPGWERGSLGVFSDDGCRFVNDSYGGRHFTHEFQVGETVGLGMMFSLSNKVITKYVGKKLIVDVFFTRNGRRDGGWNLHEQVDAEAGSVEGLEGDYDLYGAVGLFGGVDFTVCFDPTGWLWRPT